MRSLLPPAAGITAGLLGSLSIQQAVINGWAALPWAVAAALATLWWVAEQRAARYRSSLVTLTQYCAQDQAEHYFVDVVPDEILVEVFPASPKEGK